MTSTASGASTSCRRPALLALVSLTVIAVAGCTAARATTATRAASLTFADPAVQAHPGLRLGPPGPVMRLLAEAYNRRDAAALHAVTSSDAFWQLGTMRLGAVDLRFASCKALDHTDYQCSFTHRLPGRPGHGSASVYVSWTPRRGWFMASLKDCGGG